MLSNIDIEVLLKTKKTILQVKPKDKSHYNHKETEITLEDENSNIFNIFVRENIDLPERFSVWLIWYDQESKQQFLLRRYNGSHWEHTNKHSKEIIKGNHIHYYEYDDLQTTYAKKADDYQSVMEALKAMFEDIHTTNYQSKEFFPEFKKNLFSKTS